MKAKKKTCSGCSEERFIWKNDKGNRYCQYCWTKQTMTGESGVAKQNFKSSKVSKPIAPRSAKRAKQERETIYCTFLN